MCCAALCMCCAVLFCYVVQASRPFGGKEAFLKSHAGVPRSQIPTLGPILQET